MPPALRLLTLPVAILLASCATTTGGGGTDVADVAPIAHAGFCAVAKPITWSAADTAATVTEVKAHNAVGKALCGWR
jgi:predicted small secreted protein